MEEMEAQEMSGQSIQPNAFPHPPNVESDGPIREIWGTSVQVADVMRRVFKFVKTFRKEFEAEAHYIQLLRQMYETEVWYLNLDLENVMKFDFELFEIMRRYPQEVIPIFDEVFKMVLTSMYPKGGSETGMEIERRNEGLGGVQNEGTFEESGEKDGERIEWKLEGVNVETRPFGMIEEKLMRDLGPEDLDSLISLRGMIIRTSMTIPDMNTGFFECTSCGEVELVPVKEGRIFEPSKCSRCHLRFSMKLDPSRSIFIDKQVVKLQEAPESVPEGATPQSVHLSTHDSLVDAIRPGDKVIVTGIYRASQVRMLSGQSNIKQLFKTFVDVLHFKRTQKASLSLQSESNGKENSINSSHHHSSNTSKKVRQEGEENEIGNLEFQSNSLLSSILGPNNNLPVNNLDENDDQYSDLRIDADQVEEETRIQQAEFLNLSQRPDIYDVLTRSLAPSIWEMEDVKRGILCQLFGGSAKSFANSNGKFRSEINILLCGDPGTSKSQLLQFVHKVAPRGIYTSGKGSSAVGLTAYITRDEDTGETVLESGALTLSDRGICCIDEFDKMSDATRSILHEAMEQQTVSVAKAGIIATLNARTSILASANPRESRYNKRLSVVENIQLPPTLLSRFDLIYLVLDHPDRESDSRLARHIVSMYFKERLNEGTVYSGKSIKHRHQDPKSNPLVENSTNPSNSSPQSFTISTDTLKKYIAFAKRVCNPAISDEAGEALVKGYVKMRKSGASQNIITATTRQLESLIRLSEALAKMRLSSFVTPLDVTEAIRLMEVATYKAAMDPLTGRLDMDLINTGRGAAHEQSIRSLAATLIELIKKYQSSDSLTEDQLWATLIALSSDPIQQSDFNEALHHLDQEEQIIISGSGRSRRIQKMVS